MLDDEINNVVDKATENILHDGSDVNFLMDCMGLSQYLEDYSSEDEEDEDGNPDSDPAGWKEVLCPFFTEYFNEDLKKIHHALKKRLEELANNMMTLSPLQAFRVVAAYDLLHYSECGIVTLTSENKKVEFAKYIWEQPWMDKYDEDMLRELCEKLELLD